MDWFTHMVVPYLVARFLKRPRTQRVAAGVGGAAPDLDYFYSWVSLLAPELYMFAHRGISHTVWGAPLMGFLVFWVLSRPRLTHRYAALRGLHFNVGSVVVVALGAGSHLVLDMLTSTGTPALWPLYTERITLRFFFFMVPLMAVVSLGILVLINRRRSTRRRLKIGAVLLAAIFLSSGALRLASYPYDAAAEARVAPTFLDWRWVETQRNETGVVVLPRGWGAPDEVFFFYEPNRTRAQDAVAACQALDAYTGWRWAQWGHTWVNSSGTVDQGWDIVFRDSVRDYLRERPDPNWFRQPREAAGDDEIRCHVDPQGNARLSLP